MKGEWCPGERQKNGEKQKRWTKEHADGYTKITFTIMQIDRKCTESKIPSDFHSHIIAAIFYNIVIYINMYNLMHILLKWAFQHFFYWFIDYQFL